MTQTLNLMINLEHQKRYKKYTKILPEHRKLLQQRQKELKEVVEMKAEGYQKFQSKDNVINIKFAEFKKKERKLTSFIELKINELKESIRKMENYINEYKNIP